MSGYVVANILGGLLIVTSIAVALAKTAKMAAYVYAVQSLVLVGIFISLGVATSSTQLFIWAASAFVTKVIVVPAIMLYAAKKTSPAGDELKPRFSPVQVVLAVAVEVLLCFAVISRISLPTALEVQPALAISLAHFFIGLTCIVSQRSIVRQIFGYCLMENGSHLTLALLAPGAPEIVEIGVATDAFLAVIIMVVVALRVYRIAGTLNAEDLMKLKG